MHSFVSVWDIMEKLFFNWFGAGGVDLMWIFGSHDKEVSVGSLCAAELEEQFPYWDNLCHNP